MKRHLYIIMMLAVVALNGMAQTTGEAFYIYRNDGQFNAFFRDEVDSIAFSHYDLDSVYYSENVTQIIYTADTLYRIPLAAIDSVSFVQPETIYQPNVVQMAKNGLMDYLKGVDGMTLLFDVSVPRELRPGVGEVLLYTDFVNPLLGDGFVGKVLNTQMTADAFRVSCDSIYDIFDVFEQLISVEKIEDESAAARRRISDDWVSERNSLNFDIGLGTELAGAECSASGTVSGSYIATVAYKITRKEQTIDLRLDHDWQYGINFKAKADKGISTLKGKVVELPALRFAHFFKLQISGVAFAKVEGNAELDVSFSSHEHSYLTHVSYHNGSFGGTNHKKPAKDDSYWPEFEVAFSLNGSVHLGCMVDFWLGLDVSIKGIAKDLLKMGSGLDFYVGPKASGDFAINLWTGDPINIYSMYKDSKIRIDVLHVDYEFFGEAAFAGHKTPKALFCNGSIESPLSKELYVLPEFSSLFVEKDLANQKATISTTPTRAVIFPINLGIGLYEGSNLKEIKYESKNYWCVNGEYQVSQAFSPLEENQDYTAKPFIKISGFELPAFPEEKFKMDDEVSCPDENHPHWIDLGLPSGTLWRCCNEGASAPEEYGNYYTFGQVATVPTLEQVQELIDNTTAVRKTMNGKNGCKVKGPNGATIFLPLAGYYKDGVYRDVGTRCYCWTSSPYSDGIRYCIMTYYRGLDWSIGTKSFGNSVRSVQKK